MSCLWIMCGMLDENLIQQYVDIEIIAYIKAIKFSNTIVIIYSSLFNKQ